MYMKVESQHKARHSIALVYIYTWEFHKIIIVKSLEFLCQLCKVWVLVYAIMWFFNQTCTLWILNLDQIFLHRRQSCSKSCKILAAFIHNYMKHSISKFQLFFSVYINRINLLCKIVDLIFSFSWLIMKFLLVLVPGKMKSKFVLNYPSVSLISKWSILSWIKIHWIVYNLYCTCKVQFHAVE